MDIIALVTLYFPDKNTIKNILQLEKLVSKVVLLDNTPGISFFDQKMLSSTTQYIHFSENLGLSKAYNYYLKQLKEESYIVFFDQDSYCDNNVIGILRRDYSQLKVLYGHDGVLGPSYFEINSSSLKLPKLKKQILNGIYNVSSIITSGMFTKLSVLRDVGLWNEEMFLDLADWDLCWRVKKKNYFCCLSNNIVLRHRLGIKVHKFLFFELKEGSPFRVYYQIRDGLKLIKKNYTPITFKIRMFYLIFIRSILYLLFLDHKLDRLVFLGEAIKDYLRGKNGSL